MRSFLLSAFVAITAIFGIHRFVTPIFDFGYRDRQRDMVSLAGLMGEGDHVRAEPLAKQLCLDENWPVACDHLAKIFADTNRLEEAINLANSRCPDMPNMCSIRDAYRIRSVRKSYGDAAAAVLEKKFCQEGKQDFCQSVKARIPTLEEAQNHGKVKDIEINRKGLSGKPSEILRKMGMGDGKITHKKKDEGIPFSGKAWVTTPKSDIPTGGLTQREISDVFHTNLNQLRHCYEQALQRFARPACCRSSTITINSEGRVDNAVIRCYGGESDIEQQECLRKKIMLWTFPKPRGNAPMQGFHAMSCEPL